MTNALPPRCDASWIQTASGQQFWPLNPRPDEIHIEDIAHSLARICRYTGHTKFTYSVAQHSVIGSYHCDNPKWFLLHDASEAYFADIARPVKKFLAQWIDPIEDRLLRCVADRFGLSWPMPSCVKHTDLVMLATERRDLMPNSPRLWQSILGIRPLDEPIVEWTANEAKEKFLARFHELFDSDTIRFNTAYEG